jgi:hypothetical protein
MKAVINKNGLTIKLTTREEKEELEEIQKNGELDSDNSMYDFFEIFIANSEFVWILPEEIGALTDAPILGIKDENEKVIEAYAFMDYQVKSILKELLDNGKVFFQQG